MNTEISSAEASPRPREGDGLDTQLIYKIAVAFVFLILASLIGLGLLFRFFESIHFNRTSEAAPLVKLADLPPLPRVQVTPALDLEEVRAAEDQHLLTYRWLDQGKGVAQIPIDRAMAIWVATQNLTSIPSAGPATNAAPAGETELQMRQNKALEGNHAP